MRCSAIFLLATVQQVSSLHAGMEAFQSTFSGSVSDRANVGKDRKDSVNQLEKIYKQEGDYKEAEKYDNLRQGMGSAKRGLAAKVSAANDMLATSGGPPAHDHKSDAVYKQIEKIYAMEGNGKEENVYKAKIGGAATPKHADSFREHAEKKMESAESQIEKIYAMEGGKSQKSIYKNILKKEHAAGFCTPGKFIGKKGGCEACTPGKFSYGGKITWCEQCPAVAWRAIAGSVSRAVRQLPARAVAVTRRSLVR